MHLTPRLRSETTAEAAFRRVTAIHAAQYPDTALLEFAALMASGCGSSLTVAAFRSDETLRILPRVARHCAEVHGLTAPDLQLLVEPDIDAAFESASGINTPDLLVMRPQRLGHRVLSQADCSICVLPLKTPRRISRILACVDLNEDGRNLLLEAGRLYRSFNAEELLVLHVCCLETYTSYGHNSVRTKRLKDVLHFVHGSIQKDIDYTPLLEESGRPNEMRARVTKDIGADLVLLGRHSHSASLRAAGQLAADCGVPVLRVRHPGPRPRKRARLRQFFSSVEPSFG